MTIFFILVITPVFQRPNSPDNSGMILRVKTEQSTDNLMNPFFSLIKRSWFSLFERCSVDTELLHRHSILWSWSDLKMWPDTCYAIDKEKVVLLFCPLLLLLLDLITAFFQVVGSRLTLFLLSCMDRCFTCTYVCVTPVCWCQQGPGEGIRSPKLEL